MSYWEYLINVSSKLETILLVLLIILSLIIYDMLMLSHTL